MSPPAPLTVALVGAGRMARIRAQALSYVDSITIATICDTEFASATRLASDFGAAATTDLGAVLADPVVDAVILTTPTPTHARLIRRTAEAGKHIFVEKPIAGDMEGARQAVDAVEDAGVQCQVGFQRRFDPAQLTAKHKIEAGELGRIEGFRAVSRDAYLPTVEFLRGSGGLMLDLGIHDLDCARFLVGEVYEVSCIGAVHALPELKEYGLFDSAVGILRFSNGALGTLEAGLCTGFGYEARTEVLGERGKLRFEVDSRTPLRHHTTEGVSFTPLMNFGERYHEAYTAEIRAFGEHLQDGKPVSPDARDGLESLCLALAAQRSLERGTPVTVREIRDEVTT